jgi:hypothetical protein
MIQEPEDEEFERIEREQARANGWRKRQLEDEEQKRERCPACNRVWEKDDYAD